MTYTYVEMEVSEKAYDEIKEKLLEAGYQHAIHGEALDMHGIALIPKESSAKTTAGGNSKLPPCEECGKPAAFIIHGDRWSRSRAVCLEHKP